MRFLLLLAIAALAMAQRPAPPKTDAPPTVGNCRHFVGDYSQHVHDEIGRVLRHDPKYVFAPRSPRDQNDVKRVFLGYLEFCMSLAEIKADLAKPLEQRKVRIRQN